MNIVMIHGQNHKGTTNHIGKILAEKLAAESEITEFYLPRDLNHFCVGCYSCVDDETKCPFWLEKKVILDAMEKADLFIFTSPNYCLAPSGAMKSFIDLLFDCWMVHKPKSWMFKKRAVIISTSAGASCNGVIKVIKNSLFYWGVPYIKSYSMRVAAKNWATVSDDKKEKIEKDMTAFAKKLDTDKVPSPSIKTKLFFSVFKKMHTAGWDSSPTEKEYWESNGWLSKTRPWKS